MTKIKFSFRNKKAEEESEYQIFADDMFIGWVYPKYGPMQVSVGTYYPFVKPRIGWIATAWHHCPPGEDDHIHVHGRTRMEVAERLRELREEYGWNACPVGKRSLNPGELVPPHTCKRVPGKTLSVDLLKKNKP